MLELEQQVTVHHADLRLDGFPLTSSLEFQEAVRFRRWRGYMGANMEAFANSIRKIGFWTIESRVVAFR
jgi:hypothetical protein